MMTNIEKNAPISIADADRSPRGAVHPSPSSWKDQVVYHLMIDRFSDGGESERPMFSASHAGDFASDQLEWAEALKSFCGGTLKGVESKLDYLRDLGVTTLWLSPVIKQHPFSDTYHGYAMQNFLEVEPRFGTRQDLRDLVDAAHAKGMYIILDAVINHIGHCFYYDNQGITCETMPYRPEPPYPVHGWVGADGSSLPVPLTMDDGVWPKELQNLEWYSRCGRIEQWDPADWEDRTHDLNEFRRGDFFELKNVELSRRDATDAMIRIYQYWIAVSDCDGFRLDTVKHVPIEAVGRFCRRIREFAHSIGKDRFVIIGEVTGGSQYVGDYLTVFGRNIDGFLDIGEPAESLASVSRGECSPQRYAAVYDREEALGELRRASYHFSILDDHDMVGRTKRRFASYLAADLRDTFVAHATGVQLTALGVPTIYYGSEQAFVGNCETAPEGHRESYEDRYVRETMFGGEGGGYGTRGCHFFDVNHPAYLRIAAIARLRTREDHLGFALRRGRVYARCVGLDGGPLQEAVTGGIMAWSRVVDGPNDVDVLVAFNTSQEKDYHAQIRLDPRTVPAGTQLTVVYDGTWRAAQLRSPDFDTKVPVVAMEGESGVELTLPPGGMIILANMELDDK